MRKQLELPVVVAKPRKRTRVGGRLVPLGRRPRPERAGFLGHRTREAHDARHPVHVTMRRVRLAPSFRAERIYAVIVEQLRVARARGVRVVEKSVQEDHLHLMVEGASREDLSRQMRILFSRIAMAVNAVAHRSGALFRDRHHRHELRTPREVRNALVYILFNARKHGLRTRRQLDERSSAPTFEGWDESARPPPEEFERASARARFRPAEPRGSPLSELSEAATWLAHIGWRRAGGPIRFDELPRQPR